MFSWVKAVFRRVLCYIVQARSSYQLQLGVSCDCRSHVGKKMWKELDGKTLNEVEARLPALIGNNDQVIRALRSKHLHRSL